LEEKVNHRGCIKEIAMGFSTNSGNRTAMSEINVTPLVDVMLVLLIIFMVTAPMMQEGVTLDLPQAKNETLTKDPHAEDILIAVSSAGKIFVNESEVAEDRLAETIQEATKDKASRTVYLRADQSVSYGIVARIMSTLINAGIKDLSFITSSPEEHPKRK
jgi:biopolymer transport protein TolR